MRNISGLAAVAAAAVLPASSTEGATVQLDSVVSNGTDYTFNYGGTLASTEGIKSGSTLVIYDFAGYVPGSIGSAIPTISAMAELLTTGFLIDPSVSDDPGLYNLVFTYTGPDLQTTPAREGSPYSSISFTGLFADSAYGQLGVDGFSGTTVKNSGGGIGSTVYSAGLVSVPSAVPEPASWGLLVFGLGAAGYALRRRQNRDVSFS